MCAGGLHTLKLLLRFPLYIVCWVACSVMCVWSSESENTEGRLGGGTHKLTHNEVISSRGRGRVCVMEEIQLWASAYSAIPHYNYIHVHTHTLSIMQTQHMLTYNVQHLYTKCLLGTGLNYSSGSDRSTAGQPGYPSTSTTGSSFKTHSSSLWKSRANTPILGTVCTRDMTV